MRSLADQVGVEKDGQAQGARAHVTDRKRNMAKHLLFDAELGLMRQRRNEVRVETMEALRSSQLRCARNRGCSATNRVERRR